MQIDCNGISLCLAFSCAIFEERGTSIYNSLFKATFKEYFTPFSEQEVDQTVALVQGSEPDSKIVDVSKEVKDIGVTLPIFLSCRYDTVHSVKQQIECESAGHILSAMRKLDYHKDQMLPEI